MGQNNYNNQNLSKYKILNELGEGGFGKAYKVQNKIDKNIYVIKRINIKSKTPEELKTIENEALILKQINNEYIVKYIDSFIDNDHFNIVMEYCDNKDLKSFINTHKNNNELINEEVIYNIILDICYGIKEIHSKNLIHRDLKPENLFISKDYKIKIGDFGISKQLINTVNYANTNKGTYNYMAPEIINGEKHNLKVDIWSLGCILYELLTLNLCFGCVFIGGLIQDINKNNHGTIDTNIYNKEWQNIIDLLLKKDYHERPEIDEVINKIKKIKESIKPSNYKDLDNISLNILKRKMDNNEQSSKKGIIVPEKIKEIKNLNKNNNKKILKKKEKEKIKAKTSEMDIRVYQVVFMGPSLCGTKTALILRIADNHFHEQSIATVGVDFKLKRVKLENGEIIQLSLLDTVGQEYFRSITFQYISKADCIDCIVLGFSVTNKSDLMDIKNSFYPKIKEYPNIKLIYLVGNKIDVEDEERKVDKEEALSFEKENNLRYFEISCKTGEGVQEFYNDLINEIVKI